MRAQRSSRVVRVILSEEVSWYLKDEKEGSGQGEVEAIIQSKWKNSEGQRLEEERSVRAASCGAVERGGKQMWLTLQTH